MNIIYTSITKKGDLFVARYIQNQKLYEQNFERKNLESYLFSTELVVTQPHFEPWCSMNQSIRECLSHNIELVKKALADF